VGIKIQSAALAAVILCMSGVLAQSAGEMPQSPPRIRAVVKCGGYLDPYLVTVGDNVHGTVAVMRGAPAAAFQYGTFTGQVIFAVGADLSAPSVTGWRIGGPRIFVKMLPADAAGPPEVIVVDATIVVAYAATGEAAERPGRAPARAPAATGPETGPRRPPRVIAARQAHVESAATGDSGPAAARRKAGRPARFDPADMYGGFDAPAWDCARLGGPEKTPRSQRASPGVFIGTLGILQPDFASGGADATQMIAKWVIRRRRMPELPRDAQNPFLPLANARFERLVELSPGGTLPAPRGGEFVIRSALGSRQILERHALGRNIVKDFRGIAYQVDAYDVQTTALPGVMCPAFNLGRRVPAVSHLANRALYYSSWK